MASAKEKEKLEQVYENERKGIFAAVEGLKTSLETHGGDSIPEDNFNAMINGISTLITFSADNLVRKAIQDQNIPAETVKAAFVDDFRTRLSEALKVARSKGVAETDIEKIDNLRLQVYAENYLDLVAHAEEEKRLAAKDNREANYKEFQKKANVLRAHNATRASKVLEQAVEELVAEYGLGESDMEFDDVLLRWKDSLLNKELRNDKDPLYGTTMQYEDFMQMVKSASGVSLTQGVLSDLEEALEHLNTQEEGINSIEYAGGDKYNNQLRGAKRRLIETEKDEVLLQITRAKEAIEANKPKDPDAGDGGGVGDAKIEKPEDDNEGVWSRYVKRMIELGEYDSLLGDVRELILGRLNLEKESDAYGRKGELDAYKKTIPAEISSELADASASAAELLTKAEELEYIRSMTDVAHLYSNSASMCVADIKGFPNSEGGNNLKVENYDYFCQPWDGKEQAFEKTYKHAALVHPIIEYYLDWLRFGDGSNWNDGDVWKGKARRIWRRMLGVPVSEMGITDNTEIAFLNSLSPLPGVDSLGSYDREEIEGLIYNVVYGLGIRQHAFLDKYAVGATPTGKLGEFSGLMDTQFAIVQRYQTYKDPKFNPSAAIFRPPSGWINKVENIERFLKDLRGSSIAISISWTQKLIETFAPLRKSCPLGKVENGFEGDDIATSYPSLFEFVFMRADQRRDARLSKDKKQYLFSHFLLGHEAFLGFKEHLFKVPGDTYEVWDKDPAELRESLLSDFDVLLTTHSSNIKRNNDFVNWNHVAYSILNYIDVIFRVYGLCEKASDNDKNELLKEIRRKLMTGGRNLEGLGKRHEIYDVDGSEPLAWNEDLIVKESTGEKTKEPRGNEAYCVLDFVLNRLPQVQVDYQPKTTKEKIVRWIDPTTWLARLLDNAGGISKTEVGDIKESKDRVQIESADRSYYRSIKSLSLWLDRRGMKTAKGSFEETAKFVFGMPVKDQREKPDAKAA